MIKKNKKLYSQVENYNMLRDIQNESPTVTRELIVIERKCFKRNLCFIKDGIQCNNYFSIKKFKIHTY